jgi:hypothetical protein
MTTNGLYLSSKMLLTLLYHQTQTSCLNPPNQRPTVLKNFTIYDFQASVKIILKTLVKGHLIEIVKLEKRTGPYGGQNLPFYQR